MCQINHYHVYVFFLKNLLSYPFTDAGIS